MTKVEYGTATHEAAKYAVEHWHYSRVLPAGKTVRVGVWEDGKYIGVVIFSRGAVSQLGTQWGFNQTECCELTRVALNKHQTPVSQIVAHALRYLKETNPDMRLVVSFADTAQGHHGGIYQAGNWIYSGSTGATTEFIVFGKQMHLRSIHAKGWKQTIGWVREHVDPNAVWVKTPGKHRYLMPLDKQARRRIMKYAQPFPGKMNQKATNTIVDR